jgi:prepilin signal peptidase PulO-like enzyme (type II secretory pathway)
MNYLWLFFGICIGSFLNGLSFRALNNKNLLSYRSSCPCCKANIAWYDLIPIINWLFLKGKCRHCNYKIPIYYPLIELLVGIFTFYFFSLSPISATSIVHYVLILSFFFNALTDMASYSVYDPFLYFMLIIAFIYSYLQGNIFINIFYGLLLVTILFLLSFFLNILLKKQTIGSGDFFIFFMLGMILSSENILLILLLSSSLGIVISIIMKKNQLPLYPLLFISYIFLLFRGNLT